MPKLFRRFVILVAILLVFAPAIPAQFGVPKAEAQQITVELRNIAFSPRTITVTPGTTVVWVNQDPVAHTVTADDGSFDSGLIQPGGTYQRTFQQPGTYPYHCRPHGGPGGVGMSGVVVVQAPGQPAPAPTPMPAAAPMPAPAALPGIITSGWPPVTVEMRAAQTGNQVTFVMLVTNRSDRTYSYELKARLPLGSRLLSCQYGTHRTDWRQCGLDGQGGIGWNNVSGIRPGAVVGPYTFTVEVPGMSASSYAWVNFYNNTPAGSWTGPIVVSPAAARPIVRAASTALGTILVDERGLTLYMFTQDVREPSTSNCYGICAANWPPLLTTDRPVAGPGVRPELLGVTIRADGTLQVTYNGWPLYYWFRDAQPGDTRGQNVGGVWFVLRPDGTMVRPTASP